MIKLIPRRPLRCLVIPFDRYWISKADDLCPECGKEYVFGKCQAVCLECFRSDKFDIVEIGEMP